MRFSDKFKSRIAGFDCEAVYDAPMRDYVSFKTGGDADLLVTPKSERALLDILKSAGDEAVPVTLIGSGSNLLVSDEGIRGVVVRTAGGLGNIYCDYCEDGFINCGAGAPLKMLCIAALDNSLTGLEFAYGIPGSAGGAVYMNAGAYGGEMRNVVYSARHIDGAFNPGVFYADELDMSYRHSVYSGKDYVISGVTLKLEKGNADDIRARMDETLRKRREKQPLQYPSAGSTFKRPEGYYVGSLIEELGLKGYSIGGAAVSTKHAGFVINTGNATSADILNLINYIKETVYAKKGVILETEVVMLGF